MIGIEQWFTSINPKSENALMAINNIVHGSNMIVTNSSIFERLDL